MDALEVAMRMFAVYHKTEPARFVSHLDVQRTLHRLFRRAKLPLEYSLGFNPHPELSFASALATGATSDAEWFEVKFAEDIAPDEFVRRVNEVAPRGFFLSDAFEMKEKIKTLAALTRAADYSVEVYPDETVREDSLRSALEELLSGEIDVEKRTKSGMKNADIRPDIMEAHIEAYDQEKFVLFVRGKLQADGGLRAELLVGALLKQLNVSGNFRIHRRAMYFEAGGALPQIPATEK